MLGFDEFFICCSTIKFLSAKRRPQDPQIPHKQPLAISSLSCSSSCLSFCPPRTHCSPLIIHYKSHCFGLVFVFCCDAKFRLNTHYSILIPHSSLRSFTSSQQVSSLCRDKLHTYVTRKRPPSISVSVCVHVYGTILHKSQSKK